MRKSEKKVKPSGAPHKAFTADAHSSDAWWYEDMKGIEIYIGNGITDTLHCRIPWCALIAAAKRCGVNP